VVELHEDDGVTFDPKSVRAARIKEDAEYEGVRVNVTARIGSARLELQVDVGFGDAVTPAAVRVEFPTLLGGPPPKLRAYPRESVVAEKLEAMVHLGIANSRMKDFFDVWFLAQTFAFDGSRAERRDPRDLRAARDTRPYRDAPLALTSTFAGDATKLPRSGNAFITRGKLAPAVPDSRRSCQHRAVPMAAARSGGGPAGNARVTERADLDESLTSVVQVDAYGQGTQVALRCGHEVMSRHFLASQHESLPEGPR
jgi:hypothetical protein